MGYRNMTFFDEKITVAKFDSDSTDAFFEQVTRKRR